MEPHEPTAEDGPTGATSPGRPAPIPTSESHPDGLAEVAQVALKLGFTAFGGPAAHIAMLREETVVRRQWLSDAYFLDLVGATNLIPGPNSTEMVIHVGYLRAGWRGLLVAGTLFILPAATIVLALAWAYVQFGTTPAGEALLYGIKPVVIAVVAQALWGLGRTALKGPLLVGGRRRRGRLYLLGFNELAILFGGALVVLLVRTVQHLSPRQLGAAMAAPFAGLPLTLLPDAAASGGAGPGQSDDAVPDLSQDRGGALRQRLRSARLSAQRLRRAPRLADRPATARCGGDRPVHPGPGLHDRDLHRLSRRRCAGAVLATVGIFLPAFIFVALLHPLVPRLRRYPWTAAMLDGVNVAAMGLMAAVTWLLGRDAIVDPLTATIAIAAAVLLIRFRVNSAWLVLAGAVVGLAVHQLR